MRLSITTTLGLALPMAFSGCALTSGTVVLSDGVRTCPADENLVGLHVHFSDGQEWKERTFDKDGTSSERKTQRPAASNPGWTNNARRNYFDFDGAQFGGLFPALGFHLKPNERPGFPASRASDGQRVAAAVVTQDPTAALSDNWMASVKPSALVLRSNSQQFRLSALPGMSFYTIAWNPNATRLATIERNYDRRSRRATDLIDPHSPDYSDLVFSVYGSSGQLLCQSVIASKARSSQVLLTWD